jgi:hypothetical protein
MIIGDPYKFAIIIQTINEWNLDDTFSNGILMLSVNGEYYPKDVINATLKYEVNPFKAKLQNIVADDRIFKLDRTKAFEEMYNETHPHDLDIDNDYRFVISPQSCLDNHYYIFAVNSGDQVRILGARLNYNIEESRHILRNIDISEICIDCDELNKISLDINFT